MPSDTYDVYFGVYVGMPRDHHPIWVDTGVKISLPDGKSVDAGETIQVTGNIQQGMTFQVKDGIDPEEDHEGKEKIKIGTITQIDLERLKQICSQLPAPSRLFNGPRRIDPDGPLYRCQEWTREAIQYLKTAEVRGLTR